MEFIEGDADIDLEITGLIEAPNVKGVMKVSDLRYRYPVKMRNKGGDFAKVKNNYAKKINWNLKVFGGENVYFYNDYYNNYAQVYLKIGEKPLIIQGRGNDMEIYGNVKITRGAYKYFNTQFSVDDMRDSKAVFDGLTKPVLDVYAETTKRGVELARPSKEGITGKVELDVFLHVWGRVGDAKIEMSSEPSLERNRLISVLTLGRDFEEGVGEKDIRKMADAIANSWIKQGTEQIKGYTPFDVLDIRVSDLIPREEAEGTTETAKEERTVRVEVGLGTYLTEDIYLGYNLRLMEEEQLGGLLPEQELGAEFSLAETMKVITKGIFRSGDEPYIEPFEGFAGFEFRKSFESWGAKPTPTPEGAGK